MKTRPRTRPDEQPRSGRAAARPAHHHSRTGTSKATPESVAQSAANSAAGTKGAARKPPKNRAEAPVKNPAAAPTKSPAKAPAPARPRDPAATPRPRRPAASYASRPPRAPFVLLILGLLGGSLISLLLLNTILAQRSFTLESLQERNTRLTQQVESLEQEVAYQRSPEVLARKARSLGMVPTNNPAFLDPRTGAIRGNAGVENGSGGPGTGEETGR